MNKKSFRFSFVCFEIKKAIFLDRLLLRFLANPKLSILRCFETPVNPLNMVFKSIEGAFVGAFEILNEI